MKDTLLEIEVLRALYLRYPTGYSIETLGASVEVAMGRTIERTSIEAAIRKFHAKKFLEKSTGLLGESVIKLTPKGNGVCEEYFQ